MLLRHVPLLYAKPKTRGRRSRVEEECNLSNFWPPAPCVFPSWVDDFSTFFCITTIFAWRLWSTVDGSCFALLPATGGSYGGMVQFMHHKVVSNRRVPNGIRFGWHQKSWCDQVREQQCAKRACFFFVFPRFLMEAIPRKLLMSTKWRDSYGI